MTIVVMLVMLVVLNICAHAVTLDVTAPPYSATCNGTTDDAAVIQAAIDTLPSTGGTVTFPSGQLCGVGSAGLLVQSGHTVILEGLGVGAGVKALAPGVSFGGYGPTLVRLLGCADCEVRHLTFAGNGQATNLLGVGDSARVKVVDNHFTNNDYNGALVSYGNMDNLYAFNTTDGLLGTTRALWIGNTNPGEVEINATIADNTIVAVAGTGIVVVGSGQVLRNMLDGTGNTNGAGMALACTATVGAHDLVVRGNTVIGFAYQGIQSDCINDGEYTLNITLSGNTIRGTTGNGIYVVRARQWTIQDNTIEDVGAHGIFVTNATRIRIDGNHIGDTRVGGSRTVVDGIRVVGQMYVLDVANVKIDHNVVDNVTNHGIHVTNVAPGTVTDVKLRRNVLTNNSGYGIFVADVTDGDITKVVATQNILQNNSGGDIRMDPSDGVVN